MLNNLLSQYEKTKWNFFLVQELKNMGVWDKDEANNLVKKGIIRKRRGINGDLIELMTDNI